MDAKRRQAKTPGLDDNWKGMKINPLYNTSAIIKAAGDKIRSATSKKTKK